MDKYRCWDCGKEIKDGNPLPEDVKKKSPRTMDGDILIICKDCWENEDC